MFLCVKLPCLTIPTIWQHSRLPAVHKRASGVAGVLDVRATRLKIKATDANIIYPKGYKEEGSSGSRLYHVAPCLYGLNAKHFRYPVYWSHIHGTELLDCLQIMIKKLITKNIDLPTSFILYPFVVDVSGHRIVIFYAEVVLAFLRHFQDAVNREINQISAALSANTPLQQD